VNGSMLTVSVILPAYEAAEFVGNAVRSALDQTLTDLEVLLVDDGSSDGTAHAARAAAGNDPRLRVIRQARNGGVSAARNAALRVARGRWIALLDADDAFTQDRLARLVAAADACNADLLADHVLLQRDGTNAGPLFDLPRCYETAPLSPRRFVAIDSPTQPIGFMKPLLRRSFLDVHGLDYPEGIDAGEDFHVYVRCLLHGARLFCLRGAYYLATARAGSLSRTNAERTFATFERSTELLRQEAMRLGRGSTARALARRASDVRSYYAYDRLSDALHQRRFRDALPLFFALSRRSYLWRRIGTAARRRVKRP
jgi:succinoglycan biosynthesis protein ExoO